MTITKSMTIDGIGGGASSILGSGTNGININAAATDVITIRNVQINGAGTGINGIRVLCAKAVHIENCEIYNFSTNGVLVDLTGGTAPPANVEIFIKNCTFRNINPTAAGGNGAVLVKPPAGVNVALSMENTSMETSLFGLRVEDRGTATLKSCFSGNHVNHGYLAVGVAAAATINLENCVAANNNNNAASSGVQAFGPSGSVRLSNSTVFGNRTGIITQGGGALISFGNNRVSGNGTNATTAPTSTTPSL